MEEDKLEISSTGFRWSYLRFLADGAAGLFAVLVLMLVYYFRLPIPFHEEKNLYLVGANIGQEGKILLMALLVILSVPFGLIINGFGWFLLGWVQTHTVALWVKFPWLTAGTNRLWQADVIGTSFDLRGSNLYAKSEFYNELLKTFQPEQLSGLYHVEGLKRLVRSGSMLLLVSGLYFFSIGWYWWMLASLAANLIFLLVLSLLQYYHSLAILCRVYIIATRSPGYELVVAEENILAALTETFAP